MEIKLIGKVDLDALAEELHAHNFRSCQDADQAGWLLTTDPETRAGIDSLLAWWSERKI